jgi:hypothetical protein
MRSSPRLMLLIILLVSLPAAAEPVLTFDDGAVVASQVTPGAQLAWFSIAWDRWQGTNRVTRRDRIDVASGGEATFKVEGGIPDNSIWVAIDLASGEYAIATPDGSPVRLGELPNGAFAKGNGNAADMLVAGRDFLEVLVARPGAGAWGDSVGHGGASDAGRGADQFTRASVGSMRAIGQSGPPPKHVMPGDVVILIDPNAMECFATRLGGSK